MLSESARLEEVRGFRTFQVQAVELGGLQFSAKQTALLPYRRTHNAIGWRTDELDHGESNSRMAHLSLWVNCLRFTSRGSVFGRGWSHHEENSIEIANWRLDSKLKRRRIKSYYAVSLVAPNIGLTE
jgi:hypothetical protein